MWWRVGERLRRLGRLRRIARAVAKSVMNEAWPNTTLLPLPRAVLHLPAVAALGDGDHLIDGLA